VLCRPQSSGFSISLLVRTAVSATTQACTCIWLKPSPCCRAPVPSPCLLISRHRRQSLATACLHAVMLLLADATPAIPETYSALHSHRKAAEFPCDRHRHLLSSSLSGMSCGLRPSLDKIGPIPVTEKVLHSQHETNEIFPGFLVAEVVSIVLCQYFIFVT